LAAMARRMKIAMTEIEKKDESSAQMREAPDRKERERALDPGVSFIVQAPAGSGKTTLLIQRFLRLLGLVKRPEEILAITFTRKAAGEMHGRIMAALGDAASGEGPGDAANPSRALTLELAKKALERDREQGWKILENPSRLHVQTIDSFSAMLTHRTPLLSRLGTGPALTERPWPLYEEAACRTLALLDEDSALGGAIMQILRYNDNNAADIEKKIVLMLAKRDQWLRHLPAETDMQEEGLREALEGALRRLVEDGLARAAALFPPELGAVLAPLARYAAAHVPGEHAIAALRDLEGLPPAEAGHLASWKALVELLLTKSDTWRSPTPRGVTRAIGFPADKTDEAVEAKEGFIGLLRALQDNEELLSALAEVRYLPGPRYTEEDWKTLFALVRLLPVAVAHLNMVFMEEGVLDFPAISLGALQALGAVESPSDLMLHFDNRLSHILVDEYQDTSWTQVSLISALTAGWERGDGRTLFLVGDPMQSIYRFRDADVGLFLRAAGGGLGNVELEYIRLRSNFRSTAPLVEWVNRTIGPVFPHVEDPVRGAVSYAFAEAAPKSGEEEAEGEEPGVKIKLYPERDDEQEAEDVLEIIRGLPQGSKRAVLGRTRGHLQAIVERFRVEGIDFQAKDLKPLGERPVINDLLALERALIDLADRVAWLAVLRAPWCALSLSDLHALCLGAGARPIWSLVQDEDRVQALSDDGREDLLRFRGTMRKAMDLRARTGARRLLEGLWTALGGPALYEDKGAMREAGRFFEIVEALDREGRPITAESLEERVDGLYAEGTAATENPVQVMTIHGAKGLEFDYVVLPGLGKTARGGEREILYWLERGDDLLLAPMEKRGAEGESLVYHYLKGVYRERDDLERTRLLYVAATRAAKGLYLLGHLGSSGDGEMRPRKGSFLYLMGSALEKDMMAAPAGKGEEAEDEAARGEGTVPTVPEGQPLRRLGPGWSLPSPAPPCGAGEGPDQAARPLERPVFDWAGATARHVGTVVHRYLCRMAEEGLDNWDEGRLAAEARSMEAMLRGLGLGRGEASAGARKCVDVLRRAITDERGRWVLGPHEEAGAELALTGVLDGAVRRVVIDRTFVDGEGRRWVIDYKTGEHRGGSLERFLEEEKERYRAQLEGYARLLENAGRAGEEIRKGLYYPAIPAWCEL